MKERSMKIDKLICCSNKYAMLHFFHIATNWVSGRVGAMAEIRPLWPYLPKLYIDFKKKEAFSLISHMFIRIFFLQGSQVVGLYYILWPQCYLI